MEGVGSVCVFVCLFSTFLLELHSFFYRQFEPPSSPTGLTPTLVFSTSSGISQENSAIAQHQKYVHIHSAETQTCRLGEEEKLKIFLLEGQVFIIPISFH